MRTRAASFLDFRDFSSPKISPSRQEARVATTEGAYITKNCVISGPLEVDAMLYVPAGAQLPAPSADVFGCWLSKEPLVQSESEGTAVIVNWRLTDEAVGVDSDVQAPTHRCANAAKFRNKRISRTRFDYEIPFEEDSDPAGSCVLGKYLVQLKEEAAQCVLEILVGTLYGVDIFSFGGLLSRVDDEPPDPGKLLRPVQGYDNSAQACPTVIGCVGPHHQMKRGEDMVIDQDNDGTVSGKRVSGRDRKKQRVEMIAGQIEEITTEKAGLPGQPCALQ